MTEDFIRATGTKAEQYEHAFSMIKGLTEAETNTIANLANIAAVLKVQFNWLWAGFYLVEGDELVLGPFQGPVACTRIPAGKGVCGTSWVKAETLVVDDVTQFPGHIACSSASRSEIVVPIFKNKTVMAVLDADSTVLKGFDETDKQWLEKICALIKL